VLDEEFSITTSKQRVELSAHMWDLLREHGVQRVISRMRQRAIDDSARAKTERESSKGTRASEQAMAEAAKSRTTRPGDESVERKQRQREALDREIHRIAKGLGVDPSIVAESVVADTENRPYKLREEDLPGAPFYRAEQIGAQFKLFINRSHRFFADVYAGPESTPRLRAAIEVLLFVLSEAEVDAEADRRLFYENERHEWSKRLSTALARLERIDAAEGVTDEDLTDEDLAEGPPGDGRPQASAEPDGRKARR
jgi:hypothetical protein